MFVLAAVLLPEAAADGIVTLPAPWLPWLAPACILAGVAVQLGALAFPRARSRRCFPLCVAGALFVFVGAALDRDVSVAVGELLALVGIWFAWRQA